MCPPSFIEITCKVREISHCLTTRIIIIITRATGPRAQWAIPFPHLLRERTRNRAKGLDRVYMTSYSTLMVIMALSASVSKLQPCEICLTSILTYPGQSRSKPMALFGRESPTSYSTLMVTMVKRSRDLATICHIA